MPTVGSEPVVHDAAASQVEGDDPAERWGRVKSVFLAALERPDSDRCAFLDEACGTDRGLRCEVESLLSCHFQAVDGGFLDELPASSSPRAVLEAMAAALDVSTGNTLKDRASGERPTHAAPGITDVPVDEKFGDYLLLESIGQGGMGVVYRARQISLNRVVALKMIRAGRFSTPGEIERFSLEAEAAAGLTHPGIVPVYEIGQQDGHHYYTMALVDGLSLAEHLKDTGGPFEPGSAAQLIRLVAEAVQYAHERGVIHRDLKPANILLDESLQPRVVDFGLAKQVDVESGLTFTGQVLGTPSFMSPEQAGGAATPVGPASDIYSLGAVLYALLTGRPPFNAASLTETLRQVQHDEPVRPRQLNSALPKDLETICLKCLAKEPARRYESARAVADELRRFLQGHPIQARPIGRISTFARWCRRNPLAASFIAFLATFVPAVIVVLSLMVWQVVRYWNEADARRVMAEQSFRAARNAVDEQFTLVSQETLLDRPGLQPLRRELLLGSKKYYEDFLAARGDDPSIRAEAALINFRLGVITAMLAPDSDRDATVEATAYLTTARQIYELLPDQESPGVLAGLGNVWTRLGQIHNRRQEAQEELAAFRTALEFRTRLVAVAPDIENQRQLANAHMNLGQVLLRTTSSADDGDREVAANEHLETARTIQQALLASEPGNAQIVRDHVKCSIMLADSKQDEPSAEAERDLQAAFATLDAQVARGSASLEDRYLLAIIAKRLGTAAADSAGTMDELESAARHYEEAITILEPLAAENPQVIDYLSALGATYYESGLVKQDLGADDEARQQFHSALRLIEPLTRGRNPDDILRWAGAHVLLAELEPIGSAAAIRHLQQARALLVEKLSPAPHGSQSTVVADQYRSALAEIEQHLAALTDARQ